MTQQEEFCDFPRDVQDKIRTARKARACVKDAEALHEKMDGLRARLYDAVGNGVAYDAASKAMGDVRIQINELETEEKTATDCAVAAINYHRALAVIWPEREEETTDG